jgi:AcrR family transcriptional regulator
MQHRYAEDERLAFSTVVAARRFGSETSLTRGRLLDAAAVLMLREGYPAVTSRRVAAEAGLNPALVHYYFRRMDDLFLALHRRRAEQGLQLHAEVLASDQPLWTLWEYHRDAQGTGLTMEFVALANHRKAIRAEIKDTVERFRAEEIKMLKKIFKRYGVSPAECPPMVAAMLLSSVARFLAIEETLDMFTGHAQTVAFVERFIRQLEGERRAAS